MLLLVDQDAIRWVPKVFRLRPRCKWPWHIGSALVLERRAAKFVFSISIVDTNLIDIADQIFDLCFPNALFIF